MQIPSSISTRLQYQHKSLLDLIDGLSDEEIRMHIVPGKWSVFEQIVHLETYQHIFINRVKRMLEESNPAFTPYSAESDPLFHEHCTLSSREIMQNLLSIRKDLAAEVLTFPPADLAKTGIHPAYGQFTLLQWLNFFLLHEAHHLFSIFKLCSMITMEKKGRAA